jgi:hypothetical protein
MTLRKAPFTSMICALSLALLAPAVGAAASAPVRTIRFSGVLRGGVRFERRITDSLRFVLDPGPLGREGWFLGVFAADRTANFAGVVTPPFHGPNALDLEAWHFRNADNTGPNRGDVNALRKSVSSSSSYRHPSIERLEALSISSCGRGIDHKPRRTLLKRRGRSSLAAQVGSR